MFHRMRIGKTQFPFWKSSAARLSWKVDFLIPTGGIAASLINLSLALSLSLAYHPSLPPPHCFCTTVFFLSSPLRPISSQALERNPLPFDQQLSRHARHSVVFLSFFNLLRSANAHMLQQRGGRCASSRCIFFL